MNNQRQTSQSKSIERVIFLASLEEHREIGEEEDE